MAESGLARTGIQPIVRVAAGQDLLGEKRGLGINTIDFKVSSPDGGLFAIEITSHLKGGPGRHIHVGQDEWFYVLEGEYIIEIGPERFRLGPGDSVLGPRGIPHAWAFIGTAPGRFLAIFTPRGKIAEFFLATTGVYAMPPQDADVFRRFDMELVGPPLVLE